MALSFDPRFGISPAEAVVAGLRIPQYVAELRQHASMGDQRDSYNRSRAAYAEARLALRALRSRGYVWLPTIEQGFRAAQLKAESAFPLLSAGTGSAAVNALKTLDASAAQVRALGDAIKTPALAGAIVQQFNTAARLIAEATQAIDSSVGDLANAVARLRALVAALDGMYTVLNATTVTLAADERLVLAVQAKWDDAPSGEQKGEFILTDKRILFFHNAQEAVAGRWFAREKVQVREISLERPLSALQDISGGTEGWVFKDQVVHLRFGPDAGSPASAQIEVDAKALGNLPEDFDEATEWSDIVRKLIQHAPLTTASAADVESLPDLPELAPLVSEAAPPLQPPPKAGPLKAESPKAESPKPELVPTRTPMPQSAALFELPWLEVELSLSPDGYLVVAVPGSSFGQHLPPVELRTVRWTTLQDFANALRQLAYDGVDLTPETRTLAWQLFSAVFAGRIASALHVGRGMAAAQRAQLLVRLMITEPQLRAVPWEVMCGPDSPDEFLAHHREIQVVRGLFGAQPVVQAAPATRPHLLIVAPGELGDEGAELARVLREAAGPGWVIDEPLLGEKATWSALTAKLHSSPDLAIVHFLAHGRVRDGVPEIKLAGHGAEWTPAELVANALSDPARRGLRLVYLESCVSGEAGELASAGERIAAAGVTAVIAHLWPVSVRGARVVATRFYETLLESERGGDVAEALDAARLCAAGNLRSAEFLCPVLFLRGGDPMVLHLAQPG